MRKIFCLADPGVVCDLMHSLTKSNEFAYDCQVWQKPLVGERRYLLKNRCHFMLYRREIHGSSPSPVEQC